MQSAGRRTAPVVAGLTPAMSAAVERLNRAVGILVQSYATGPAGVGGPSTAADPAASFSKKKSAAAAALDKERRACEDIREVLTSWQLPGLHLFDLNRSLGLLFISLNHREPFIRLLADQALDAIFRKFQLKFQLQRVIVILLTELSKKSPARSFCAALHKLAHTVHLSRAQRAGAYGLHFMNSICSALARPEDAIHAAVAATFAPIFVHFGAHVASGGAPHAEKADELFHAALVSLALPGAAQRAAAAVMASVSRHVPHILHKAFYRLNDIIFEADDSAEGRTRLAGALTALRLMWPTIVETLTELSRPSLQRLLCRVLCLIRGSLSNEVLVAALELLSGAVFESVTSHSILDFNPLRVETAQRDRSGSRAGPSTRKPSSVGFGLAAIGDEMEMLGIDDLDNPLSDPKADAWYTSLDLLDGTSSSISEFPPLGRVTGSPSRTISRVGSSTILDEDEVEEGAVVIIDPLLNCDRYLNADEEIAAAAAPDDGATPRAHTPTPDGGGSSVPDQLSADICVGHEDAMDFCVYTSLCVGQRFLLSGLVVAPGGALRDDRAVRVSQKILALKCLAAAVGRQWRVAIATISRYNGQQALTDVYGFIGHEDEGLALAAANFLLASERAAVFAGGRPLECARILLLLRPLLRSCGCDSGSGGRAAQLKGLLQAFTGAADLIVINERILTVVCQLALASMDCDYFLAKIARVEFFSALDWRRASTSARRRLQSRCRDALLQHLFDEDARVRRAACTALPTLVQHADLVDSEEQSEIFHAILPDLFMESGLKRIPTILGLDMEKFSLRGCGDGDAFESALATALRALHSMTAENFHINATGALSAWRALADAFPPASYPGAWLAGAATPLSRNSFLCLLLELANGAAVLSLADVTALAKLLASILAGMAEQIISKSQLDRRPAARPSTRSSTVDANFPVEPSILEGILIFYLRVLNMFHSIVAEEKTRHFSLPGGGASLLARAAAVAPAAELARKIVSPRRPPSASVTTERLHNFSYLVGTAVRPSRPTSYLQASSLRQLEPALAGAYRNFLESMNTDRHALFLEPLEAALNGLCAVLEILDFESHVRTFLDELLLYLRTVFDVSPALSARCVHQCLKALFGGNVRHLSFGNQRPPVVVTMIGRGGGYGAGRLPVNDPLEALLTRSQHEFTVFTAFAAHSDYLEAFAARDAGWLGVGRAGSGQPPADRLAVADRLRQFDPFVTRLMQIYPLTNAPTVRLAILNVLCTLVMNDVRYEMIDSEKKFYWRVVAQVRQPATGEDVPLLGPLFWFLVALSRVGCVSLADVVGHLTAALSHVEESGATAALDAVHVVLLEARRLLAECGATMLTDDAKSATLREARAFLGCEFDFLFAECPKAAAHMWILLLDSARRFAGCDWWAELSLEFLTRYAKFVATAPRRRPSAIADFVRLSVAFSCCEPSAFRPIDQLYDCMRTIFDQITGTPPDLPSSPSDRPNGPIGPLAAAAAAIRSFPLLFVTLCRLDEAVVLLRLGHYDSANDSIAAADRLGADVAVALMTLTHCLVQDDLMCLTGSLKAIEEALIFLTQIVVYNVHAKRAPLTTATIRHQLIQMFEETAVQPNDIKPVGRLIKALAWTFPRAHAFWLALLTALEVKPAFQLYFQNECLSRTKSLVVLLILDKLSEYQKSGNSNQKSREIDSFFAGGFVAAGGDDFCARLLKWSAHPSLARRRPLDALPPDAAILFAEKIKRFLAVNRNCATALRPQLEMFKQKLQKKMNSELCGKNITENISVSSKSTVESGTEKILKSSHDVESRESKSHDLLETEFDFYSSLAQCAATTSDLRKIVAFLTVLSTSQSISIIDKIPREHRLRLYDTIFAAIRQLDRVSAIETHANCGEPTADNEVSALRQVVFTRLQDRIDPAETVQLMAGLAELSGVADNWLAKNSGQLIERIFNDLIAHLMISKLNHIALKSEYFGALGVFFSQPAVRSHFSDDFYALDQMTSFLRILWTDTVEKIPRWRRLSAPAGGWPIDVNGSDWRDEIVGLFDVVQRVVHVFCADALPSHWRYNAQLASAFKAILRLSLPAKLAAVPEVALRLGWRLAVHSAAGGQIAVPLVHIHMLAGHVDVLSDFVWRMGWLGWTARHQFEEFWMSLLGVLSSTPAAANELAAATAAGTASCQLQISATAVEALTGLLLSAVGRRASESLGTLETRKFFVKHRRRPENYLFLDTSMGRAASSANYWLLSQSPNDNLIGQRLAGNLDFDSKQAADGWANPMINYGIGQTSLDYLWTLIGQTRSQPIETTESVSVSDLENPEPVGISSSISSFLLARSTEPDTTSSLRALFDNFLHWSADGFTTMPIQLLSAILKSMALASDLVDDVTLYCTIFDRLRSLFMIAGGSPLDDCDESARGYATLLLLKCVAVIEWKDLLKASSTVPLLADQTELARLVETIVFEGLRRNPPNNFVGYCTLQGVLYLLQSLSVDRLVAGQFIGRLTDFLMEELSRLRRPIDILTDCPSDTIEYHKLVWTVAFRLVEDAVPIDADHKAHFLKLVSTLMIDPRLDGWEKRLLAGGAQALAVHSASYAPVFRQIALECLDTCQLRPSHLPYAVALYSTCFYRELNEGGELAYELNKSFPADFQKLLNAFLFYATMPDRCDVLAPILAGLVGAAWAKERVIAGVWELIAPIGRTAAQKQTVDPQTSTPKFADVEISSKPINQTGSSPDRLQKSSKPLERLEEQLANSKNLQSSCNSAESKTSDLIMVFSSFDRALLRLLYETVARLPGGGAASRRDLCWSFLLPRLADVNGAEFAQFLAALLFCAAADAPRMRRRAALLLDGDQLKINDEFAATAKVLFDNFLEESTGETPRSPDGVLAESRTRDALLALLAHGDTVGC